jgi:hypothetical protein
MGETASDFLAMPSIACQNQIMHGNDESSPFQLGVDIVPVIDRLAVRYLIQAGHSRLMDAEARLEAVEAALAAISQRLESMKQAAEELQ